MAGYKGHVTGAVLVGAAYIGALQVLPGSIAAQAHGILSNWQMLAGLLVVAVLFGLFPDVDTNSKGQNIYFGIAFVSDVILIATGRFEAAAYLGLLAMTPIIGRHRGWTHTYLAMVLVPLPIILIPYLRNHQLWAMGLLLYGAAVAGYFSHLLLDGKVIRSFAVRSPRQW
jgi:membrane-bound metal-dependent hydrolase YbcI (DUF457 family)